MNNQRLYNKPKFIEEKSFGTDIEEKPRKNGDVEQLSVGEITKRGQTVMSGQYEQSVDGVEWHSITVPTARNGSGP